MTTSVCTGNVTTITLDSGVVWRIEIDAVGKGSIWTLYREQTKVLAGTATTIKSSMKAAWLALLDLI